MFDNKRECLDNGRSSWKNKRQNFLLTNIYRGVFCNVGRVD
ncbi:hypothetical protein LDG_6406 [Legionella drancourtii LLAP12]|uniref:Uncharacterized protein n=1 Tax=Legionella drancourtii LLAP12 TaxID=658187 RepID=G9EME0_9GAMM|nr:hypothetical protein LDG_6406 [Legionella drancourtii LLAP12]